MTRSRRRRRRSRFEVIRPKPELVLEETPESGDEPVPIEKLEPSRAKKRPVYEPTEEDNDLFVRVLEELLEAIDVDYEIEFEHGDYQRAAIEVPDKRAGALIGRRGASIDALELLTGRMVSHQAGRSVPVQLDVNDYREREAEQLREEARERAERVLETGRDEKFPPMQARLRRIVHLAVENVEGLKTYTLGHGAEKRVVLHREDGREEEE